MNICGNFAKDGECGTCKYFILWGVCCGICLVDDRLEDKMATDECDCNKYEKETQIK